MRMCVLEQYVAMCHSLYDNVWLHMVTYYTPCLFISYHRMSYHTSTVEGTNCATLEQHVFIKYVTNHRQRRRLPYKAMCLETQNRDVPALPSSLCFIPAQHHSHMRWPRRCVFLSYKLGVAKYIPPTISYIMASLSVSLSSSLSMLASRCPVSASWGFFVLRAEKVEDGFVLRAEVEDGLYLRRSPLIFKEVPLLSFFGKGRSKNPPSGARRLRGRASALICSLLLLLLLLYGYCDLCVDWCHCCYCWYCYYC